jgi:hypothetical protein
MHSNETSGGGEVDDVELIIFKLGHFGVVAENESNSVASLTIPGCFREEVKGELIADASV